MEDLRLDGSYLVRTGIFRASFAFACRAIPFHGVEFAEVDDLAYFQWELLKKCMEEGIPSAEIFGVDQKDVDVAQIVRVPSMVVAQVG